MRLFPVRVGGARAFQVDWSFAGDLEGNYQVTRVDTLVVESGQDVFEIDAWGTSLSVPARPPLQTLMAELITRVRAAS
jgi:hypothetical protein